MIDSATITSTSHNRTVTGTVGVTTEYPRCQRGEPQGYAHRFQPAIGVDGLVREVSLLFCELCGQVRKLEYIP